jgi:ADP-heptose:LPS heptosyltransferase
MKNKTRDYYKLLGLKLGIFFIAQLCKFRKIIPNKHSNKIVLISLHKIGDTIFSFPTIRFFQERYGKNLTVVCLKSTLELYELLGLKMNIIPLDDEDFYFGKRIAGLKSRKVIGMLKPEIIIDITGEINSVSLFSFKLVKNVIGRCSTYLKPFYDRYIIKEEKPTLAERIFDVARLIIPDANPHFYQYEKAKCEGLKIICIHPFAGWKAKEWNLNKFIEISEYFSNKYLIKIISENMSFPEDIKNYLNKKNIELVITNSLSELITQIKNCDLFIGNDSGPANIATALGKKTFIIYGPVNPAYCLISKLDTSHVWKKLKCSPKGNEHYCFTNAGRNGCPSFECMNQLSVPEVLEQLNSLINK